MNDWSPPGGSTQSARYRVLETLGRGGMGVVYRVHDLMQEREVALKRLIDPSPSSAASAQEGPARAHAFASLRREYHTLAQLTHPNIIQVFDFGIDELGPFYTMELLDGRDLRELAPLSWQETCVLLRDVAAALALLHSRRLLHRDISPRNVCRTRAGRAKLLDFGAMSAMGLDRVLAGTPPFVAPESMARQALDGRADVFALGALAYFLLTGHNAYPARSIAELRDVWRVPPHLPSHYARDVPEALDALVLRMLALDVQKRPSSAVELIERFAALSGEDPALDHSGAVQAYLTTPSLIGRDSALLGVRRRMLRALRGQGASLLVTGPSGVGRSRFLDACALEAKLAGAVVLRAGRADASAELAAVRALLEQLRTEPAQSGPDAFSLPPEATASSEVGQRSSLQSHLTQYIVRSTQRQPLALIVDDVEDLDEPSLSLLASLTSLVRRNKLVLVCAHTADAPVRAEQALRALRAGSRTIKLCALEDAQLEAMLQSMFGAIPGLKLLAARIHGLSAGLPRLVMELCQHLLDSGAIKSRSGGFMLQPTFGSTELPVSFRDAMALRVHALSADARTLAATLARAGSAIITLEQCIALMGPSDPARSYRALSELERVQLASSDAHGLRLAKGYEQVFLQSLDSATLQRLHAHLAELFVLQTRDCVRAAEHYFAAGQQQRAIDALLAYAHDDSAIRHWFSENRSVLWRGIAACARSNRPKRDAFELRRVLCRAIALYLEPADRTALLGFAHDLFELAGADFLPQLAHEPDPERRARAALALAHERFEQLPERDRVASPGEALHILTTYIGALAAYASYVLDLPLLHGIPTLFPFTTISPGIELLESIVCTVRDFRADRQFKAMAATRANIAALEGEVRGLSLAQRNGTCARLIYGMGLTEAVFGRDSALQHAEAVATFPDHRINAWRVRYIASLFRARAQDAEACRQQLELLQLQGGPRQYAEGSSLETEIIALVRTDDLLGLTRVLPEIEARAARHSGWITWRRIVEAELERLRDNLERAIALHDEALALAPAGQTFAFAQTASLQLDLLVQAGRAAEAVQRGVERVAQARDHEVDSIWVIEIALSVAYAAAGDTGRAQTEIERLLRLAEARQIFGAYRGSMFEAAARIAIESQDAERFQSYYDRAFHEYGAGAYPPLATRLEKLLTLARRKQLIGNDGEQAAEQISGEHVRRELASAASTPERAARALNMLREAAHAVAGHLYGISTGDVELLASHAACTPSPELEDMVQRFLRAASEDQHTVSVHELADRGPAHMSEPDGLRYYPFLLLSDQSPRNIVAGVVALAFADGTQRALPAPLAAAIGAELLAAQIVTGLTLAN